MIAPSTDTNFGILQQVFADVANDMRNDPVEHLLVLTYEFDDQQLVNLLSGRRLADNIELQRNQLKFIADMHPVVVYDARKTRDFNQLPHFLDLLPVNPGAYRCHHSKAYLFVTRASVRLVLGSFNLTRGGLFENREVFVDYLWHDKNRVNADLNILGDFSRLLREGYAQWAQPAAASARLTIANVLDERVTRWQAKTVLGNVPDTGALLASGYLGFDSQHGLQRLAALWNSVSKEPPQKILAVSPFFDKGDSCLADALTKVLGIPGELHIVTDESNITKIGRRHYGQDNEKQLRRLSLIPALINSAEIERIRRTNDGANLNGLKISRVLHAKILVLCGGTRHLIYSGSANFTLKAWNGDNQELGVATIEQGNADHCIASVLSALAVGVGNFYERLDKWPADSQTVDDEEYIDQAGYPNFIKGVQLKDDPGGRGLVFHFVTDEPSCLQEYDIQWGKVRLCIEADRALPIPREKAYMPLQGGRNLCFRLLKAPEYTFLLPFYHDAELTQQQDLLIFPSAEDWLRYYTHPAGPSGQTDGEYLPGEANNGGDKGSSTDDREANIVVSMQRYLNLFSAVEEAFDQRAFEIAKTVYPDGPARAKDVERSITEPLGVYARLLRQEYKYKSSPAALDVYLFRLGELILLCNALTIKLPETAFLCSELAANLASPSANPAVAAYIEFIRECMPHA